MASSKNQIRRLKRLIKLSYLQTVAVTEEEKSKQDFVGSPQPFRSSNSSYSAPSFLFGFSAGMMGDGGGSRSVDFQDTGWTISKTWLETYWDKVRYAIGVRDVGIFQFTYDQKSEVVSQPWESPKEIDKVALIVDQTVPNEFPVGPRYIEYYISQAPGNDWVRINPLDHPTLYEDDGNIAPRIINFNTEKPANATNDNKYITTEDPVKAVKFRAVLKRPTGFEGASAMTPVLKSYRLLIYPKAGLS